MAILLFVPTRLFVSVILLFCIPMVVSIENFRGAVPPQEKQTDIDIVRL